ncbi:MAG: hypothetical protein ACTH8P_16825 [Ewingella sp.]|uniref:hypothetical protein n=1 Tax=Ewingella sp. TaxID=1897459 RepID=UPI003F90372C
MKSVQLKDVMASLRIVAIETGYEVHNAAGIAKYDVWGCRGEVNGIPEYFPVRIGVEVGDDEFRVKDSSFRTRCVVGQIYVDQKLDTADAHKKLDELQKTIEGSKAFQALSGKCFINDAFINSGAAFAAGMSIGVNKDVEAIIKNALASQAEAKAELERIKTAINDSARQAVIDTVEAVQKDFETHGPLYRALGRKLRI